MEIHISSYLWHRNNEIIMEGLLPDILTGKRPLMKETEGENYPIDYPWLALAVFDAQFS